MIEARAIVESIEKTKEKLKSLGIIFKSNYLFKDIIFISKNKKTSSSSDFIRVRIYFKTNWYAKDVVLVRKKTEWKEQGKVDNIVLKKEFDTEQEAFIFIKENLSEFEKKFEYSRKGWEYNFQNNRFFLEDIEGLPPSIEIEAGDKAELTRLFKKLGVIKILRKSVPELIRETKTNNK